MNSTTIYEQQRPREGEIKKEVHFAITRKINGKRIWFQYYMIVKEYNVRDRIVVLFPKVFIVPMLGGWDIIKEKVIDRITYMNYRCGSHFE